MRSVSVIIPCFNAAATIAETIGSVIDQGYPRLEIIVVDDGSTDDTLTIARGFEPRVTVLTGPNRGVSAARNKGLAQSAGETILFLDSDDLLTAGSVADRVALMEASSADVVVFDWLELCLGDQGWFDGRRRSLTAEALGDDAQAALALDAWAPPAALLFERALVLKIGGFRSDLPVIQDARFLFDAAFHGGRFAHASRVGAKYRVAPMSLSRRNPGRFWIDVLNNIKQVEVLWTAAPDLSERRRTVLRQVYRNAALELYRARCAQYREAIARYNRLHRQPLGQLACHAWIRATALWKLRSRLKVWRRAG